MIILATLPFSKFAVQLLEETVGCDPTNSLPTLAMTSQLDKIRDGSSSTCFEVSNFHWLAIMKLDVIKHQTLPKHKLI